MLIALDHIDAIIFVADLCTIAICFLLQCQAAGGIHVDICVGRDSQRPFGAAHLRTSSLLRLRGGRLCI